MHHAHVLCAGESKYVVHPGVRRVVRARITLRFSSRSLAVRSRRGCLGDRRAAPLVAGSAVQSRGWKIDHLKSGRERVVGIWFCGRIELKLEIPIYENGAPWLARWSDDRHLPAVVCPCFLRSRTAESGPEREGAEFLKRQ